MCSYIEVTSLKKMPPLIECTYIMRKWGLGLDFFAVVKG